MVVKKIIDTTPSEDTIRIGIGGFQEKGAPPFIDEDYPLEPQVFQNWMGLTKASKQPNDAAIQQLTAILDEFQAKEDSFPQQFKHLVPNGDDDEAGLEALVQAAVCASQIGWAEKSRHLVIFITDAKSHLAGDGKFAGIS